MPKAKDVPACPGHPDADLQASGRETLECEIRLVTPMFGGGVEAGRIDETFPFRPTEIRGQLQFWWRATVGAGYPKAKDLRRAQSDLWGSTQRASKVQVRVDKVKHDRPRPCAKFERDKRGRDMYGSMPKWEEPFKSPLPYALFPFQGQLGKGRKSIEIEPAHCIRQGSFRLLINYPKAAWDKLEPALWAWINFGGLGARTRRGCGALYCDEFAPRDMDDLRKRWEKYVPQKDGALEWPTLAEALLFGEQSIEPIEAWKEVIGLLRDFRQGVDIARNPGEGKRPGRSRWPEPETIREATRQRFGKHQRLDHIPANAFPRAELGLPIVFHFKDRDDPDDTVLYPKDHERMASPLILKPLVFRDGKAKPVILRLRTPKLEEVELKGNRPIKLPTSIVQDPSLARYPNSPLARSSSGSALDAFLQFAREEGFQEAQL